MRWKRSQSGSFLRSPPPTGAKNPFGVVSAPITSATSHRPARICARALAMATAPDAQAAYTLETRAPVQPNAWANVAPDTKPGYPLRMVSAPETNCMSRQPNPASASASRAAARPYSTKGRPHLPHSCMPAPRTATFLFSLPDTVRSTFLVGAERAPLPDQVVGAVLRVERLDHQLDLVSHPQVVDGHAAHHLAHDDELLGRQFHRGQAEGHVGVGGHVGHRGLVARVGVGPDAAPARQLHGGERRRRAVGVAAVPRLRREGEGAAAFAARPQEGRWRPVVAGGEPALDRRDAGPHSTDLSHQPSRSMMVALAC